MKIVIFSGTTEGRELSERLAAEGAEVVSCVASEYGKEIQGSLPGVRMLTGPLSGEEKEELLKDAEICVDATHPYAAHVTGTVREACEKTGVRYLRLLRESCPAEHAVEVEDAAAAAAWLEKTEGNILLTTGAKELPCFAGLEKDRLYPRILPTQENLRLCEEVGIPKKNIIAMQGPFSEELNAALIRQFGIAWLVSKDGGIPGGFPEKVQAAEETGIRMIVLRRPEDRGMTYEEVLKICLESIRDGRKENG